MLHFQTSNARSAVPTLEELKAKKKAANTPPKNGPPTLEEIKARNAEKASAGKVPWTRKVNAQPVKKDQEAADKEVAEFESCRKTLKENVKNEATTPKKIETVKKDELKSKSDTSNSDKIMKGIEKIVNEAKVLRGEEVVEKTARQKSIEKSEIATPKEEAEPEVRVKESDPKVKAASPPKDACPERVNENIDNLAREPSTEDKNTVLLTKEMSPEKPPVPPKPVIVMKEIPSLLLMTPVVRRREVVESANSVTVSASIRLPPPPSFRPPPPPMSPPTVRASKEEESESEEESEWEYESEEEE